MLQEIMFFFVYGVIFWFFNFVVSIYYASDLIYFCCFCLNEGLILQDSTIWVWALWFTALFFSFWLTIPYILFLVYIWTKNLQTKIEHLKLCYFLSIYIVIFVYCIYILLHDLFISGFFFPTTNKISFEFQPELEHYLRLLFGLFYDLFLSIYFFQIVLFLSYEFNLLTVQNLKYIIFICVISFCIFLYWFASESFLTNFLVFLTIYICLQGFIFFYLILNNIRMYKY